MIPLLDREVGVQTTRRAMLALAIGTGLLLFADLLGRIGTLPDVISGAGWSVLGMAYLLRVPEMCAMWLPAVPAVAGLITVIAMYRAGQLTALGAAGIGPRRTLRAVLALSVCCGAVAWVAADRVLPILAPERELADQRMSSRSAKSTVSAKAVGWRNGSTQWLSLGSQPGLGEYSEVFALNEADDTMLYAKQLRWQDQQWVLLTCRQIRGAVVRGFDIATPHDLGLDTPPALETLATALRPMADIPGPLLPIDHRLGQAAVAKRIGLGLLPFLILAFSVPFLVRRLTRTALGSNALQAILMGAIPVVLFALLDRAMLTTRAPIPLLAACGLGAPMLYAVIAWWRMRM